MSGQRIDQIMARGAARQDQDVATVADWIRRQEQDAIALWIEKVESRNPAQVRSLNDCEIEMVRTLALIGVYVVLERLVQLESEA